MSPRPSPEEIWRVVRVDGRSLREAADILGMTSSGVSKAVNRIAAVRGEAKTGDLGGRPKRGGRPRVDDVEVWRLVAGDGYADECAAALIGCSLTSVRTALRRHAAAVGWDGPLPRGVRRQLSAAVPAAKEKEGA